MSQIFEYVTVPFAYVLRLAYQLTDNYLLSILLFTLVMEILLSPIAVKQQKNQIKQAKLAPKVAAIRKKYAGLTDQVSQQKMQQETMDMYQRENFNPMGGCLPLLIQLPIIMILYQVVVYPLRYICNVPTAQITALQERLTASGVEISTRNAQIDIINAIRDNVSAYTDTAPALKTAIIPDFTFLGLDLSQTPSLVFKPFNWLMLIPVITFVVMILSTKIMQKFSYRDPMTEAQQNNLSMKIMTYTMPLLSVYIEFSLAAAVGIYWIFRNIIQVIERIIISKLMPLPKISKEEYEAEEKAISMSNKQKKRAAQNEKSGDRPFVRSLHHIDDEEYIARHAEELKEYEEAQKAKENYRPKLGVGKSTKAKDAPAPIKNDEKTAYEAKSDKKEAKEEAASAEQKTDAE